MELPPLQHYPNTVTEFTERIFAKDPRVPRYAKEQGGLFEKEGFREPGTPMLPYLWWMMLRLQTFKEERKIGSWMGWVARSMEVLGLATNQECRDLMGSDKPSPEWPRYGMLIDRKPKYLPLHQAQHENATDSLRACVMRSVLEQDGSVREMTKDEQLLIMGLSREDAKR